MTQEELKELMEKGEDTFTEFKELLRVFQESKALNPDEIPIPETSLEEIDLPSFERFFRETFGRNLEEEGIEPRRVLMNMKLLTKEGILTTAGLRYVGICFAGVWAWS